MRPCQGFKQASKQKRTTKAATVKVLGATGVGLSLVGSAFAFFCYRSCLRKETP
jgi:hypothetical protein